MAKLIILRGLPASGKSTKAKELIKNSGNTVRVNKDLLREMLHFNKWMGENEKITKQAAKGLALNLLASNKNVIIDDTNLNSVVAGDWEQMAKEFNYKFEIVDVKTDFQECLRRDYERGKRGERCVGEYVIYGMAMQYGLYPEPKKGIVICDIDGTIADIEHRRKYSSGPEKNWDKFFSLIGYDTVREDVLNEVYRFESEGYEIFFVSGRPEKYRKETEHWLNVKTYGELPYKAIFMRPDNDKRDDDLIKKDIYEKYFKQFKIHKVIDDRPRVIRMWREQGLDVLDVGDGVEF